MTLCSVGTTSQEESPSAAGEHRAARPRGSELGALWVGQRLFIGDSDFVGPGPRALMEAIRFLTVHHQTPARGQEELWISGCTDPSDFFLRPYFIAAPFAVPYC